MAITRWIGFVMWNMVLMGTFTIAMFIGVIKELSCEHDGYSVSG